MGAGTGGPRPHGLHRCSLLSSFSTAASAPRAVAHGPNVLLPCASHAPSSRPSCRRFPCTSLISRRAGCPASLGCSQRCGRVAPAAAYITQPRTNALAPSPCRDLPLSAPRRRAAPASHALASAHEVPLEEAAGKGRRKEHNGTDGMRQHDVGHARRDAGGED